MLFGMSFCGAEYLAGLLFDWLFDTDSGDGLELVSKSHQRYQNKGYETADVRERLNQVVLPVLKVHQIQIPGPERTRKWLFSIGLNRFYELTRYRIKVFAVKRLVVLEVDAVVGVSHDRKDAVYVEVAEVKLRQKLKVGPR